MDEDKENLSHPIPYDEDSPDDQPPRKHPPLKRFLRHAAGLFKTTKCHHINEHGVEVYGRLPRPKIENPIKTVMRPTLMNYVYFFVGWMAWTMDGYDFFTVSLSLSRLAEEFNQPREHVSTSITLTLLFRSVGAILFGLAGDLYGRKYPLIINLIIVAILELATAFCVTFKQFLAVRSLFGIGMGGIWGLSASMALENMPVEARGLMSGILQQGYSLGYLIAAVFNLALVPKSSHSWRLLFYIGAGMTVCVAFARLFFPESKQFLERKEKAKNNGGLHAKTEVQEFMTDLKDISKRYWKRMLYCIALMTFFNAMSHTSQDLYPTYLQQTKGFTPFMSSKATIIGSTGAIVGGTILGYYSQVIGRRLSIITACILGAALIPLWILPTSWSTLAAGAFFMQFMVQGAWGIVPVHLQELSPPHFRSSFPGIAYQVGNMISSACPQIAASIAENWIIYSNGEERPDYARTQGIMMTFVFILLAVTTFAGTEVLGSHFDKGAAAGSRKEQKKEETGDSSVSV